MLLIESDGGKVGLADFQEDAGGIGTAEVFEGGGEERRGGALAAGAWVDGEVEDFGLVRSLARGEETAYQRLCFADEEQALGRIGKPGIAFQGPVGSF